MKLENFSRMATGRYGNAPMMFSPGDFLHFSDIFHLGVRWTARYLQLLGSKTIGPLLSPAMRIFCEARPEEGFVVSEYIPPEWTTAQGEFGLNPTPHLRLMDDPQFGILKNIHNFPHRDYAGLEALVQLRRATPYHERIEELAHTIYEKTTDPVVVEFSMHRKPVGVMEHPLIIWEVRNY